MFNIALYQPDIPQNTAAIIRLCSCFGVTLEIIEPCGFHLSDKRFKRVVMDYMDWDKINIYQSSDKFFEAKKNQMVFFHNYNFPFANEDLSHHNICSSSVFVTTSRF